MQRPLRALRRVATTSLATLLASALVSPLHPGMVAAAGNPPARSVHSSLSQEIALSRSECRYAIRTASAPARTSARQTCAAALTVAVDAVAVGDRSAGPGLTAAASTGCTTTWVITSLRATVQSVFWGVLWSATANATGYGDSCGRVMWTSVTCDSHGIGFSVRTDWCGAYPRTWTWYGYTSTNMGLNITVSAVTDGTPVSFTHGARNGFNPYTGTQYGFFAW